MLAATGLSPYYLLAAAGIALLVAVVQTQRPVARSVIVTTAQQARDEAQSKLAESQIMLRSIIDNNLAAIAVVDPAGEEVMANRAWHDLFEDVGRDWLALHAEAPGAAPVREEISLDVGGSMRHLDTIRFPLSDASGDVYATCAMALDITERRQAAEVLERSVKDLEGFAFVASHDLQAPLHTITTFTDIIEERHRDALGEKALEYLRGIRTATGRGTELVHDLLEFSRAGSAALDTQSVSPEEVLAEVLEAVEGLRRERDATIVVGAMPGAVVDPGQLRGLFQNLLVNALKYVPADRTPRVEISATARGRMVEFAVIDNGRGIPVEMRTRIFDMFFRGAADDSSGTGLGLAVCQRVVERHGGRIWVEPAGDTGSAFRFTLPAAAGATAATVASPARPSPRRSATGPPAAEEDPTPNRNGRSNDPPA
jgi:signal transduction histidine kinase